jgi:hypothetical protein
MEAKRRIKQLLWGVAIAAVVFPLVPLFDHLGKPEFERPVPLALIVIMVVVKVCRDLRGRLWFWITIIAIAALHVPLVMQTAQWLTRISFRAVLFLGVVDCLAILAVISLIERLVGKFWHGNPNGRDQVLGNSAGRG